MIKHHDVRTTMTIDDDIATLLQQENRKTGEPMKQTINRVLRCGLTQTAATTKRKRFVVKPLNLGITAEQWAKWDGMRIEDILEEAERQ